MTLSISSNWKIFQILLWRNCLIHFQNFRKIITALLISLVFGFLLLVVRLFGQVKKITTSEFTLIDLQDVWQQIARNFAYRKEKLESVVESFTYNTFMPNFIIAYAPNTYQAFENIVDKAARHLEHIRVKGFETCAVMREEMVANSYFVGVCFDDEVMNTNNGKSYQLLGIYPNNLKYTLVFPSELRIYYDTYVGYSWLTCTLFDINQRGFQRNPYANDGGSVGYIREGFASLQDAISTSYIQLITKREDVPMVFMKRFPFETYIFDPISDQMDICVSLIIILLYIYPVCYFAKSLVTEKETKQRTLMKLLGAKNCTDFAAWIMPAFILVSICSILLIFILMIHWSHGFAICNRSSYFPLLLFMLVYNLSMLCFAYMICAFFSETSTAITILSICWFVSYIPFLITKTMQFSGTTLILLSSCFANSALSYGFSNIFYLEENGVGLHWFNYNDPDNTESIFTVGLFTLILLISAIVYVAIGLLTLNFKMHRRCLFKDSTNSFDRPSSTSTDNTFAQNTLRSMIYEKRPSLKKCTLELKNVNKNYKKQAILKNVSIELYESEILMLMGHNGSGKTTLISTIIGLTRPASGMILHHGVDISATVDVARKSIGVFLESVTYFQDLTVNDQLTFFTLMRGVPKNSVNNEVQKFLEDMDMVALRDTLIEDLPLGKKNLLGVCCALAGNSSTVLLDGPAVGMDLPTRKRLFDILVREKNNRTILLTTYSIEDAESFADRIAILSGGELKCYGSILFLKKFYGNGYRLICTKGRLCEEENVTAEIQKLIPGTVPECNLDTELSYTFDIKHVHLIEQLLGILEENADKLGLQNWIIRELALEDIYLRLGADNPSYGENKRHCQIMNGETIYAQEYSNKTWPFLEPYKYLGSSRLWLRQCRAMLHKHFLYFKRKMSLLWFQLALLPLIVLVVFAISNENVSRRELCPITYSLDQYAETITVLDFIQAVDDMSITMRIADMYRSIAVQGVIGHHKLEESGGDIFSNYILVQRTNMGFKTNFKYVIGATISDAQLIAWFNNYPLHTVPLSLNLLHSSILKAMIDSDAAIFVSLDPLPYSTNHNVNLLRILYEEENLLTILLTYGLCFLLAISVMFLVKERGTRFKLLQFISGVRIINYWLSILVSDMLKFTAMCMLIVLTMIIFNNYFYGSLYIVGNYLVVLLMGTVCILSCNYIVTFIFKDAVAAYLAAILFGLFGASCNTIMSITSRDKYSGPMDVSDYVIWILRVFPHFSMGHALSKITIASQIQRICIDNLTRSTTIELEGCKVPPYCCRDTHVWGSSNTILPELLSFLVLTIICWMLVCHLETRKIHRTCYSFSRYSKRNSELAYDEHIRRHDDSVDKPDDVANEYIKLLILKPREVYKKGIILSKICNYRLDSAASISSEVFKYMVVDRGECLGLIGNNNAGKSTLMKMLVGDEEINCGYGFIAGINLGDNLYRIYEQIGYAPQNCALFDEYRIVEILELFSLLRGIPINKQKDVCISLAKILGLYQHYHKHLLHCTSGIKRRVSLACALIGHPAVVLLDLPNMGIDISGRRQLLYVISKLRQSKITVLATATLPKDCETNYDRVSVISEGHILCIATPFELTVRYMRGYILKLHIKPFTITTRSDNVQPSVVYNPFLIVASIIESELKNSVVKEQQGNKLIYFIPYGVTDLATIFKTTQRHDIDPYLENFSISRANLTLIFSELIDQQIRLVNSNSYIHLDTTI